MARVGLIRLAALVCLTFCPVAAAGDGGRGTMSTRVVAQGRQPQAAVDGTGRIHLVYGNGNEIRYVGLDKEGEALTNPVIVAEIPDNFALGMRRGPRIAVSDKAIVITAIGRSEPVDRGKFVAYAAGTLLSWRSTDGGRTWQGPVAINTVRGSASEGLQALTAAPDGTFFSAWNDNRSQAMEVYGARSTDGGATWTDETLIYHSPDKAICPCCHPSATFAADGSLFVMWRNQIQGHRDLYLARSLDGGKTFEAATKLGKETWSFNACPMDGGAILAQDKNRVDTIWMREGRTFAARPGEAERSLGRGVQGWGAMGQGGAYFAWLTARPGKLMVMAPDFDKPMLLADQANDPMVAAPLKGRGPVVITWEVPAESHKDAAEKKAGGHGAHSPANGPIAVAILHADVK